MCTLVVLIYPLGAHASRLVVINNEKAPVEVIVQPDNEAANAAPDTSIDGPESKFIIKEGEKKVIEVTKANMGFHQKISVIGKVTQYSTSERCSGLDINHDYEIVLDPKPNSGVRCRFKQIKIPE